ncbi:hypothetical protein HW555_013417, partial [Spodoptera exigua]
GKNGHKWSAQPSEARTSRTQSRNIVHIVQGPKNEAIIVLHTNVKIATKRENYAAKTATVSDTCAEEIYALIGLLLLAARKKDNHLTSAELFDPSESGTKYISISDDKSTCEERKAIDKFAPKREIWEMLIAVCRDSYKPGSYVTVDEQLLGFRGGCPSLYGTNKLLWNSKSASYHNKSLREDAWREISIEMGVPVPELKKKINWATTPRSSNTRASARNIIHFIPGPTSDARDLVEPIPIFHLYLSDEMIDQLVIYTNAEIEIKKVKYKELTHTISPTSAIELKALLGLLMQSAAIKSNHLPTRTERQKTMRRRTFVQSLADKLIEPWLRERYNTVTLRRDIKASIKDILKIEDATPTTSQAQQNKRKICSFCPYKKHRMTKYVCSRWKTAICGEHTIQD